MIAELRTAARARRSIRETLAGQFADEVMNTARELAAVNPSDVGRFFEAVRSATVDIPEPIQALITAECQAERKLLARLARAVSRS
ncbi:hypothetical protein BH11GEM2_BH11GEM2_04910 [soil metagenome]